MLKWMRATRLQAPFVGRIVNPRPIGNRPIAASATDSGGSQPPRFHSYAAHRVAIAFLVLLYAAAGQGTSPEQLFNEAVAAQKRGDDALAIRKYQELVKLRPDVVEVRANLGAALARQGRFDEAIAQYRAALARDGGNAALRMNLALAHYKKGAFAETVKELKLLPNDPRTATLLGDCYSRLGRDEQAIEVLRPVEAAQPDDLGVAWLLGSALIRTGHKRDGLERVEKVAKAGNSAEAYLLAGRTLLKMNEFERARDDSDAALRLNPRLPGALTLRGMVLPYLGDNAGAMAALRKAIEADPEDFDAQLNLGAVLLTERQLDTARQHLERALALQPESTLARYEMAKLERTEGKLEASVKDFEKVIHDEPAWPQPHIELSALYFRLNRREDGERERAAFDKLNAAAEKR
jgi:tetratricopeptide (TPR) repeat protein